MSRGADNAHLIAVVQELRKLADAAPYSAKRTGRNRCLRHAGERNPGPLPRRTDATQPAYLRGEPRRASA